MISFAARARPLAICAMLALGACATTEAEPSLGDLTARPSVSPASIEAAERALAERRLPEAQRQLERILQIEPGNARARLALGEVLLAQGETEAALELFRSVGDESEHRLAGLQGEGLALLLAGDLAASHRALDAAVGANPRLWRAWNGLGRYHDAGGRWQEAGIAYQRALDAAPDSAVTVNNLGMSLLRQERYEEAAATFARALELDSGLDAARTNLRIALAFQGRYSEALSGISPEERPQALNNLGYVALLKGDLERAEAYFMRSLEASPSFYAPARQNLELLASLEEMRNGPAGRL